VTTFGADASSVHHREFCSPAQQVLERVNADARAGNGALPCPKHLTRDERRAGGGKSAAAKIGVGLTV